MKDFRVKVDENLTSEQDSMNWYFDALNFLKKNVDKERKPSRKLRTLHRLSSLHACRALDHMLRGSTGMGLERFELKPCQVLGVRHDAAPSDPEPSAPPVLGIASDLGPSMLSWQFWLRYESAVVSFLLPDPSHMVNNNMLMAVKHAGLWENCLLNKVAYKALFGPFETQAWQQTLREVAEAVDPIITVDDPLFVHYLPHLLADIGEDTARVNDPEFVQGVRDRIFSKEVASEVGPQLQFTRWGSLVDVGNWWDSRWHSRLLLLIAAGLHLGYLTQGNMKAGIGVKTRAEPEKGPTKRDRKDPVADLRSKTKNVLHIATIVLGSPLQQRIQRIISVMLGPLRKWHGRQASILRGPLPTKNFYIEMAAGKWIEPLVDTVVIFNQPDRLRACGLIFDVPIKQDALEKNALAAEQDELVKVIFQLTVHILKSRVRSCLQYSFGYPLQFAGFMDPEIVLSLLKIFQRDVEAWEFAGTQMQSALALKVWKRSVLWWPVNQVMMNYARRMRFRELTPAMTEFVDGMFSPCFGQQKIIEDLFQRARGRSPRLPRNSPPLNGYG